MTDLLLMRTTLYEVLRPQRLIVMALLTLLPAAIGLYLRLASPNASFDPAQIYDKIVVGLIFSFVLGILSVIYGTGIISQELEQRTIVYLLIRPLPRWRLLLAKFLSCVLLVTVVTLLATFLVALVVYGPARLGEAGVGLDLLALFLGAVTYSSVFLLLGTVISRPLVWGLGFVFGWETLALVAPGSFALLSITSYLRVIAGREVVAATTPSGGGIEGFIQSLSRAPKVDITTGTAWTTLLLVTAVSLIAALVIFSRREYVPREDAD